MQLGSVSFTVPILSCYNTIKQNSYLLPFIWGYEYLQFVY